MDSAHAADGTQHTGYTALEPRVTGYILSVASLLIISTNLVVAAALLQLVCRKGSQSWCFVLNLAVADTLVGLAITGMATEDFENGAHVGAGGEGANGSHVGTTTDSPTTPPADPADNAVGRVRCLMRMAFVTSPCSASIMSMFLISLDRYVAIKKPLRYSRFSGKGTVVGALVALWLCSLAFGLLPVTLRNLQTEDFQGFCTFFSVINPVGIIVAFCACFFPVLSVFVYIYLDILKIACSHQKQIHQVRPASGPGDPQRRGRYWGHVKALRTVAVLVGCFSLFWCPFFVVSVVQVLCSQCSLTQVLENDLWLLGLSNSLINPLVYAFWQREVRLALGAMFSLFKARMMHPGSLCVPQRCHAPPVQSQTVISGGEPVDPELFPQMSQNERKAHV